MGVPRWGAGEGRAVAELGPAGTGAEVGGAAAVSACGRQEERVGAVGWRWNGELGRKWVQKLIRG